MQAEHPIRAHYKRRYEKRADNNWARASPDEATHLVIEFRDGPYTPHVLFELPADEGGRRMAEHWGSQVERLLELAYNRGDDEARAEIRRALHIKEPRR